MSYLHINNLYKQKEILLFKECYALEKIHGTSAHISFKKSDLPSLTFFAGGESHVNFLKLFDQWILMQKFQELNENEVIVYGEAYGGSQQGMSNTYGKTLKFIVFDVMINDRWLNVPEAEKMAIFLGLEFVPYNKVSTDLKELDEQMYLPSVQAVRNGITEERKREGVVLRPLSEMTNCFGERVISKHKREDFQERKTQPSVDVEKLKILEEAEAIASEWCTELRLSHVLDKLPKDIGMDKMQDIMKAMIEDIEREAKGEIVESKEARKAIGKKTVELFKARLRNSI